MSAGRRAPLKISLDPGDPWSELVAAFDGLGPFRSVRDEDAGPRVRRADDGSRFHYAYEDGTEFLIDLRENRVWGRTPPGQTLDDTAVYLLGPVLGFIARSRGTLCLHASAVRLECGAVAFSGPSGAGKSTLAAAFATAGVPVLTDDIAALTRRDDGYAVEPGISYLRLWPQSTSVTAAEGELPRLAPDWDKRYLDLTERPYAFAAEPADLAAVYLLADSAGAPPFIHDIPEAESILSLVGTTYANYMLTPRQRAAELEALGDLVGRVEVRALAIPTDLDALPAAIDLVLAERTARAGAA